MQRWDSDDVNKLVEYFRRLPPAEVKAVRYTTPALKLLDCVLSLNRRYYTFVVPRLDDFKTNHPDIETLEQLHSFVAKYNKPYDFFKNDLSYDDQDRAETFVGVLDYMLNVIKDDQRTSEIERLGRWAQTVEPKGYKKMGVYGFGLAGWQYLRMLFGADTCKPDTHINEFVRDCIGRDISRLSVVELMEASAPRAALSVKEADRRIWRIQEKKATESRCQ